MSQKKEMDQLSRDALMATRLHMTYGKYKAMKYERERAAREQQEKLVQEAKRRRAERS
ncbi:MAG: hypothetical protein ACI3XG_02850 [Faecousia sp.]